MAQKMDFVICLHVGEEDFVFPRLPLKVGKGGVVPPFQLAQAKNFFLEFSSFVALFSVPRAERRNT